MDHDDGQQGFGEGAADTSLRLSGPRRARGGGLKSASDSNVNDRSLAMVRVMRKTMPG